MTRVTGQTFVKSDKVWVKVEGSGKIAERALFILGIRDPYTIANLDRYRDITRRLSDPRKLSDDEAKGLIAQGKPIYYLTGAMHSPETASPEMLMELVYRLAVEETPFIRNIRDNVITLITPVLEIDGRIDPQDPPTWTGFWRDTAASALSA